MTLHGSNRHMGSIQGTRIYSPQPEVSGWAINSPPAAPGVNPWVMGHLQSSSSRLPWVLVV